MCEAAFNNRQVKRTSTMNKRPGLGSRKVRASVYKWVLASVISVRASPKLSHEN